MILTCDKKIIEIDFGIIIFEFIIQPIITTIVLVISTTTTPTIFLYVICYWRRIIKCDDVVIKFFKTIPAYSSITIVITMCIFSFLTHSQWSLFSYDNINGHPCSLHWTYDCYPIKPKYWFRITFKSSYWSEWMYTKINSPPIIKFILLYFLIGYWYDICWYQ